MNKITLNQIQKIDRPVLGTELPVEMIRILRLIGIRNGLPMGGKNTTAVIGRTIGESLPCTTVDEFLQWVKDQKLGVPEIVHQSDKEIIIHLHDCVICSGMDNIGEIVCDLEGAIIQGALSNILNCQVKVRETKCNCNGDGICEYTCTLR